MSNEIQLSSFPSSRAEALAMVYVQNQDLKNKTPEEILQIFLTAYDKIKEEQKRIKNEKIGTYYV